MLKALIVDDEPKAREILHFHIQHFIPEISRVEMAGSVPEALQLIHTFQPDILFLDIVMPQQDGFDLLNALEDWDFDVIFTTAHDQYAIKAIRFSALDYLLKPVDPDELQAAVSRHLEKKEERPQRQELYRNFVSNLHAPRDNEFKLAIPTADGTYFFQTKEIIRCQADRNYTVFHLTGPRRFVASRTLGEYDEILNEHGFLRVHKSHLVNLDFIDNFMGKDYIRLYDKTEIEVARRRKDDVKSALQGRNLN
ncbi:MAG: response regulator transcription factor [Lewinellaceae bacterium]|nr:response regulator transcription factor [Saprospiraceae bacterium]MCB9305857.1 response regulator transcription factor [Lewinellaceae bacterium]MCB9355760.1 response regulator transcription factor [Lewinellaceae bacterium]